MFPRGDTLALAQRQKLALALQHPLLREDRRAKVTATVSQLWAFRAYEAQESIPLNRANRFISLSTLFGRSACKLCNGHRQGRASRMSFGTNLELTQLEDRLTTLKQHQDIAQMHCQSGLAPCRD